MLATVTPHYLYWNNKERYTDHGGKHFILSFVYIQYVNKYRKGHGPSEISAFVLQSVPFYNTAIFDRDKDC